jgi:hypothetical protein
VHFQVVLHQMQRGRGRGRGRNPNPAQSTSQRGSRSNSRRRSSQTPSRASNLRRSARIAQLLNGEQPSGDVGQAATDDSMAYVARPRALGNGTMRPSHQNSRPGRSRSNRHSSPPEDIQYAMDVILQPPATARAGSRLGGTIVVRLRTTNSNPDDAMADSHNLFAVAMLVPGSNSSASSDPTVLDTFLAGRRYDSVRPFSDDEADGTIASMEMDDPRGVGYMLFPELIIRQPGTYRIRIALWRAADPPSASAGGRACLQVVDSNPITVQRPPANNVAAHNGKYYMGRC